MLAYINGVCSVITRTEFLEIRKNADKFIKIMPEYFATAVWTNTGCNADYTDFPLSLETAMLMTTWSNWFNDNVTTDDEFISNTCTLDNFYTLGDLIFNRVINELPDYVIVYDNYSDYIIKSI